MPARDGTGPTGKGPRSGRGMGNCTPDQPIYRDYKFSLTPRTMTGWFGRLFRRRRQISTGQGRLRRTR